MLKTFAKIRLSLLLRAQAFGSLGALVWCVTDKIVAGNVVGVDALAGIAATVPVMIGAQFLAQLVYCGAGYLFAGHQGAFDRDGARRVVGLSIELAVLVGLLIYAILFFGRDLYLDAMGISGGVRGQAIAYWRWMSVFCAVCPFTMTMWRLVYADGETVTTAVGDLMAPPLTVICSIGFTLLVKSAAGAALGTLVACLVSDLTMMTHVLRKTNQIVPKWNFSWRGVREIVNYSLTDSSGRLCQCGFMMVVNKLVVFSAGVAYLPVVSVIALVFDLRAILDRIGDAYMPIAKMYLGERNLPRVQELCRYSLSISLVAGFALSALIEAVAPQIVAWYGIPSGDVFNHAVTALHICALFLPISSLIAFVSSHYLVMGRIRLAVLETILNEFVISSSCAAIFCLSWGLDALWVSLPVGAAIMLVTLFIYGRFCDASHSLLLIPDSRLPILNISFVPSTEMVVNARDQAESFLRKAGISSGIINRMMLLVEECAMSVADDNGTSGHEVVVEFSLIVEGDEVRVVFRDTGRVKDITDRDQQVSNLRSFVIAGLMQSYDDRRYLNTIGCNRSAFVFNKKGKES